MYLKQDDEPNTYNNRAFHALKAHSFFLSSQDQDRDLHERSDVVARTFLPRARAEFYIIMQLTTAADHSQCHSYPAFSI